MTENTTEDILGRDLVLKEKYDALERKLAAAEAQCKRYRGLLEDALRDFEGIPGALIAQTCNRLRDALEERDDCAALDATLERERQRVERTVHGCLCDYAKDVADYRARIQAALEQARAEGAVEALADLAVGNIKGDAVLAYEDHSVEAWLVSKTWYEQELTDAKAEGAAEEQGRCAQIAEDWDWRKSGDNTSLDIAAAIRVLEKGGE